MQISRDLKLGDHGVIRIPLRNGHEDGKWQNQFAHLMVTPPPLITSSASRHLVARVTMPPRDGARKKQPPRAYPERDARDDRGAHAATRPTRKSARRPSRWLAPTTPITRRVEAVVDIGQDGDADRAECLWTRRRAHHCEESSMEAAVARAIKESKAQEPQVGQDATTVTAAQAVVAAAEAKANAAELVADAAKVASAEADAKAAEAEARLAIAKARVADAKANVAAANGKVLYCWWSCAMGRDPPPPV